MPSTDTWDTTTTSVDFPWPKGLTPVERIILAAHGDLQRTLSAFFARPVVIIPLYAVTTSPYGSSELSPSPKCPTTQKRQVHLVCADRVVCVATSAVTITSPRCAKFFLEEGYAIGQIFRRMNVVPEFELVETGLFGELEEADAMDEKSQLAAEDGKRKLWRRYTLKVDGFSADIVEVFPDRDMFTRGEEWLNEAQTCDVPEYDSDLPETTPSLSPTETLVHLDEALERIELHSRPHAEPAKDVWAGESSNSILRFIALFIAILLLLNIPKDDDSAPSPLGELFSRRIACLFGVQPVADDS